MNQPVKRLPLRTALVGAQRRLADAGVASPAADAELLAAHVLGVERGRLLLTPMVEPAVLAEFDALVDRRVRREPLQHITGWAALGAVTVRVGPGVFVPRPETELLAQAALTELGGRTEALVLDLCTGSAALALAIAAARADAEVHAVERDPGALAWARHNVDSRGGRVRLHAGDVADPDLLAELDGRVDVLVCNPPYVPESATLPPEVAGHDPSIALFGGRDGLDVIRHVVPAAARLLRPGGLAVVEHDDHHQERVRRLFATRAVFTEVIGHPDLAGRPRFVTARRVPVRGEQSPG